MKVQEEMRKMQQVRNALYKCKENAEHVINRNKRQYITELNAAIIHTEEAIKALDKF